MQPRHERGPHASLARQGASAGGGQPVVSATTLAGFFHPASFDEPLLFQAVQRGIERRRVERDGTFGPLIDLASQVVAMPFLFVQQSEDHHGRRAPLQLARECSCLHIWRHTISELRSRSKSRKVQGSKSLDLSTFQLFDSSTLRLFDFDSLDIVL